MKRLAFIAVIAAMAWATASLGGEKFVGTLVVLDGGSSSNMSTPDGGPFVLLARAKVSVQCNSAAYVCIDRATCTAAAGVKISADVVFPTTTDSLLPYSNAVDGGVTISSVVSVAPVSGATLVCPVWTRWGDEF